MFIRTLIQEINSNINFKYSTYTNLNIPPKFVLGLRIGAHLIVPGQSAVVMTANLHFFTYRN